MFQINDKVEALDDDFKGVIVSIHGPEIAVRDSDGFVLHFDKSELIPAVSQNMKSQLSYVPDDIRSQKAPLKKASTPKVSQKERNRPALEVDLHIHKLTDRDRGMSNYEMLTLQRDTAKRQLDFAIRKRIQKVVFIHGVGQGVLREELYTLFRRYDNLTYYDADFQKYGMGATEVYMYQNN